ncbi:chorismate mutase [Mangrovibacillus cuniculi]|uniref:chorismate mutase n=1 Tax=Mangrovibacillus cuniculi TaxID=2593652 RepID=A0A7S8CB17_9BACI|nr:chorismate mutase [Mangrovibacillus cuniculi]QPC46695.1 chorismate mutase [Mangrovibacillus cuniculi]
MIRGIRGATTVENDKEEEILLKTKELLGEMVKENSIHLDDIASIFISATPDLKEVFPAKALRKMEGWTYVPVVCMQELDIQGAIKKCIRVMMHVNTSQKPEAIIHVYQERAVSLRPDLKK